MSKPILSIVSGTFQRLDFARAMVQSVRNQFPPNFPYEIILVDAGSSDGTEVWALSQPDIVFIQQGQKLGAIRAFDAGCAVARGEYVALLNDDILVTDGALVRALTHLATHPDCGAVAMMDNRRAPGYDTDAFKVQTIRAIRDGKPTDVVYAQCGVFRRWLGDACGWWGSQDTEWGAFHSYGGDSRLSAEIWRRGYTVDAVEGVSVTDRVAPDQLRQINHEIERQIGSAFYRKFPQGVRIAELTKPEPPPESLRILYLPLFSPGFGRYKTGLFDALSRYGTAYELDYVKHRTTFASAVAAMQPHLILTQFHDTNTVNAAALEHARSFAPEAVVVNWMGDVYLDALTAPDMLALLQHVDLQLVVNADALPIYAEHGIAAAYWQIAAEPVPDELPDAPAFNLLFMANAYSPARKELGAFLRQLDSGAGLFGYGWDELGKSGLSFYDFAYGAALYRRCKIAIGDNQWGDKGFVSNRLFEALSNGAFLLHQVIPGLEELTGLIDGVHYASWTDHGNLRAKVAYYLSHEQERQAIAAAGEAFVREQHTFDSRVKQLFEELLPALEEGDERTTPVGYREEMLSWADGVPR